MKITILIFALMISSGCSTHSCFSFVQKDDFYCEYVHINNPIIDPLKLSIHTPTPLFENCMHSFGKTNDISKTTRGISIKGTKGRRVETWIENGGEAYEIRFFIDNESFIEYTLDEKGNITSSLNNEEVRKKNQNHQVEATR